MFSSFWKVMPVVTLFGLSLQAQSEEARSEPPKHMQTVTDIRGINEGNNVYARSCANCKGGAMEFEFLWWRAQNLGFAYAIDQTDSRFSNTGPADYLVGGIMRIDSKWEPGFRFGMGYNSNYDRWDLFANWTWYTNHAEETHTRHDITGATSWEGYYPVYPAEVNADPFKTVHASWHLWHNMFDLELGRAYYMTQQLSLRPHFGLRGGWINQKFFDRFTDVLQGRLGHAENVFHGKNNYWGVGPRIGIHGDWHIANSNWSVIGKASGSLLSGKSDVRYYHEFKASVADTSYTPQDIYHDDFSKLSPNLQLFLGLSWASCLHHGQCFVGLDAGWESNYYWNQYSLMTVVDYYYGLAPSPMPTVGNRPLTMEGLTVNLHIDY